MNKRIGYISSISPTDRRGASGTKYTIASALRKQGYEVVWLQVRHTFLHRWTQKYLGAFFRRALHKNFLFSYTGLGARLLTNTIDKELLRECDVLVSPLEAPTIANLVKEGKPLLYISDATFAAMIDYYPQFTRLINESSGMTIEKKALDNSDAIVVSSNWARTSVVNDYLQDDGKVTVVEFGANLSECDILACGMREKSQGHVHILFLGVDWERKGGQLAVDACHHLHDSGFPVTLHIVGIRNLSPDVASLKFVVNHGFLDKNVDAEYKLLVDVIGTCHCLLLPTMAECSAIAFAESSAFGLPVFSHATGGVEDYVREGVNGHLFPLGATGQDFAMKIRECMESGEMIRMSKSAQELYHSTLNWDVWGRRVAALIEKIVG